MKDDLKNVVITASLIGLVFTQGSLMYQKKLFKDYVISKEAESAAKVVTLKENQAINIVQKEQKPVVKNIPTSNITVINDTSTSNSALLEQKALEQARLDAQILAENKAKAQAAANISNSRQSRAS